jgi:hypothetical protein
MVVDRPNATNLGHERRIDARRLRAYRRRHADHRRQGERRA